jgi:A/G-specific adenine glycosylase
MSLFSTELQLWYNQNHRDLPWRDTSNPYFIWLSEVILQQTRVQQGMTYYFKFVSHYPTVKDLAAADEQEILNLWQGLGYYSRARNMHKTAKFIVAQLQGIFPNTHEGLIALPGVGNYTAAAIGSFAFDLPLAVVDGNVYRVLSRYFNLDEFIDTGKGQKYYQQLADELLDQDRPALHNQAIMELGALVCTPKNPSCATCPLQMSCVAKQKHTWSDLPKKKGKVKVKNRTFHYFVVIQDDALILQQRGDKDIWANMYEFPLIQGESLPESMLDGITMIKSVTHKLTHQHLAVHFYASRTLGDLLSTENQLLVSFEDLKRYPLPRVIEKFLEEEMQLFSRF